jgi:hypothetical protein
LKGRGSTVRGIRIAKWSGLFALLLTLVVGLPAFATVTWTGSGNVRIPDQPRTCNTKWQDPYTNPTIAQTGNNTYTGFGDASNCVSGSGAAFVDGEHAVSMGLSGSTHYLYAMTITDHPGSEVAPIVDYGPGGPSANGNCTQDLNPNSNRSVTATESGTTATFTTATAHIFYPGDQVFVSGMSVTGYNGTWTVASVPTTTTFTATLSSSGLAAGSGGKAATVGYCSQVFFSRSSSARSATTLNVTNEVCNGSGTYKNMVTYTVGSTASLSVGQSIAVFRDSTKASPASNDWDWSGPIFAIPSGTTFVADDTQYSLKCSAFSATTGNMTAYTSTWAWDGGGGTLGANAFPVSSNQLHVEGAAQASAGAYVYEVWQGTNGYYKAQCNGDPRPIYVRVNSNYGSPTAWGPITRLTSATGRYGYPDIAANGTNVYIITTASDTGNVMLISSTNNGGTWSTQQIGHTSSVYDDGVMTCNTVGHTNPQWSSLSIEGYDGFPAIATNGADVGAVWFQGCSPKFGLTSTSYTDCTNKLGGTNFGNGATTGTGGGKTIAKVSTDAGVTWPGSANGSPCSAGSSAACTQVLSRTGALGYTGDGTCGTGNQTVDGTASTPIAPQSCSSNVFGIAADSGRIGFAWTDDQPYSNNTTSAYPTGVYYRAWNVSGGWQPSRLLACFGTGVGCASSTLGAAYVDGYAPALAFYGTSGVGVVWDGCPAGNTYATDCGSAGVANNGPEILYKMSPDNGVHWLNGDPAGTCSGNTCNYFVVANNNWATNSNTGAVAGTDLNSQFNEYANLVYDNPSGGASLGCTANGSSTPIVGLPSTGCTSYVYFIGRDWYYNWYRMYFATGVQG